MNRQTFFALVRWLLCLAVGSAPVAYGQRKLQPGQVAQLRTITINGADSALVFETSEVIEAPNWTPDGKWLVCNTAGSLVKIAVDGGRQEKISTDPVLNVNNDHVLSPDGKTIYVTARDGHLYAVPIEGGKARRISNEHAAERKFRYFLHGVSPDGKTLAYVGSEAVGANIWGLSDIYTIPAAGGADVQLTRTPAPDDGPEFSPDGKWIYFNSELNAKVPGHSQVYRMKADGSGVEQLTHDERVNWFPHLSPDGQWIVYLSFPPGTVQHPADKPVILRRMRPDGSGQTGITAFLGGQGTINVNSWAPDSQRFAYVSYPLRESSPTPADAVRLPSGATEASLPPPWRHQDINSTTVAGAASASAGVFSVSGTLDIWGQSDGSHFMWQTLKGDGAIVARVLSIEQTHYHAKGGLAMRESLLADARHVTWVSTPADGTQLLVREEPGAPTKSKKKAEIGKVPLLPVWLKLVRAGDTFTAFHSSDGTAWIETDSHTVKLAETLHVGLVASSHQKDKPGTATFDQVAISRKGE